jgi:predicted dienelactone hydrolase
MMVALEDRRIQAAFAIDPVDGPPAPPATCAQGLCPDVSAMIAAATDFGIPTGFIGETVATESIMTGAPVCAPAEENFATFYEASPNPSFSVEIFGASHMSFLDKPQIPAMICKASAGPEADALANAAAKAFMVAFFERYLKDDAAYETYLTGAAAQDRYVNVSPALAEIKNH